MLTRRQFGIGMASTAITAPQVLRARVNPAVIRIGSIQPISGNLSAYAQEGQPAFDYVIRKINAEGGIKSMDGARIETIVADDTSIPARTASEARRLATSEQVCLLTGTMTTAEMLAVSPTIDELEIPTLAIWSAGVRSKWMYSIGFPYDRGYAKSMVDLVVWLRDKQGFPLKTVVTAYSNYEAGQQINKSLTRQLQEAGFQIVGDIALDTKAQDQTAAMIRIRSLRPDLVMGQATPRDGVLLHQARFNLNYHDSLFVGGTGSYADVVLWRDLGENIGRATLARNLFGMTAFATGVKQPATQKIVSELHEQGKLRDVGQFAIQGAQAARVIQRIFEIAGSTEKNAILAAMQQVDIPAGSPDLYLAKAGGLQFGPDRMPVDSTALFIQWTPGHEQEVVFPPEFATASPRTRT